MVRTLGDTWVLRPVDASIKVPPPGANLEKFLLERLQCPVYSELSEAAELNMKLDCSWSRLCCDAYQVDLEASLPFGYLNETIDDRFEVMLAIKDPSDVDLRIDSINAATWYSRARDRFLDCIKLIPVGIAQPSDYSKHYPRAGATTRANLQEQSRGSGAPSILLFECGPEQLRLEALRAATLLFDEFLDADDFRCVVECDAPVGLTDGKLTRLLAIAWSPDLVHAYPVSPNGAATMGVPVVGANGIRGTH